MKTITVPVQEGLLQYDLSLLGKPEELLFVDIETTGFAARSSCLYLIGCLYFDGGFPVITQFFAQKPSDEDKILSAFLSLCREKRILIHYNGNNFDIPYLKQKCAFHSFSQFFEDMEGVDLYKRIMPYKRILGVENLKQKTMEKFLSIPRKDTCNGGELIDVYRDYVTQNTLLEKKTAAGTQDPALDREVHRLERLLLLHNGDDMRGMFSLLSLLSYADMLLQPLKLKNISLTKVTEQSGKISYNLVMKLSFTSALPKRLSLTKKGCLLKVEGKEGVLEIPLIIGELKYFYGNYKEYYYLPAEDTAIHKSVAAFVSPEHRIQATADTCYTKKEGRFLPEWDILFEPFFKISYKDPVCYFELTEDLKKNPDAFLRYAEHVIDMMMHEKK